MYRMTTNNMKKAFSEWAKTCLLLFATLLSLRIIFYIIAVGRMGYEPSKFAVIMSGLKFDIILTGSVATASLIPYVALSIFSAKTARIMANTLLVTYSAVTSLLVEYFCTMSRPLDHVLLAYSPDEIVNIVMSSASVSVATIAFVTLSIGATLALIWASKRIDLKTHWAVAVLALSIYLAFNFRYRKMIRNEIGYEQHSDFYLAVNQFTYSYIKISDHLKDKGQTIQNPHLIDSAREQYQSLFPERTFTDASYPFWHKTDYDDVLGKYFNKTSNGQKPNIVFIIVESFGRKLTGVDNPTVSYTPFIDSLARSGLFWENCLSTTERTFGVLPAIFASAPQGKFGFANMWYPIPDHNTILKDLARNGYLTSFFYGGCASFDGQDKFLKNSDICFILEAEPDTTSSERNQELKKNHRWGIDDAELINMAIRHKTENATTEPFADVYLTLSTHEPFDIPDMEKYIDKIRHWGDNTTGAEKEIIDGNLNTFACYNYMDECIHRLIDHYQSRPGFENTIFIITGDHRTGTMGKRLCPISKYHIPLIIWSPLLRECKTMKAVVSHLDIAPSLNAYLSNNYKYETSAYCHWLGTGLDTASNFQCKKIQAFMLNNRDVTEFLLDSTFISNKRLFKVNDNLTITQIDDQQLLDSLTKCLDNYQTLSEYVVNQDYLTKNDIKKHSLCSFSKHNSTNISSDCEYGTICPNMTFDKAYEKIKINVRFSFMSLDTTKKLPKLVIEKSGKQPYYLAIPIDSTLNTGNHEEFNIKTTINFEESSKDDTFKLYLWNNQHGSMTYQDISVNINSAE